MNTVQLELEDGIAWVAMNRPDKKNAISVEMAREMVEVFDGLETDERCKVVVLTGRGALHQELMSKLPFAQACIALTIDGVLPTFDTIADGRYAISRPLYVYVKKAHVGVIPGIEGYLREFTSESAAGEFGYLSDLGLVPLRDDERSDMVDRIESLEPLTLADLGL